MKIFTSLQNKTHLFALYLFGCLCFAIQLFTSHSLIIGILGMLCYFSGLSIWVAQLHTFGSSFVTRIFWSKVLLLFFLIPLCTITYYIYGITPISALGICLFSSVLFLKKSTETALPELVYKKESNSVSFLLLITIVIAGVLLTTLIQNKTTGILISPWQTLEPWFFLLYGFGLACLFIASFYTKNHSTRLFLHSVFLFIAFGVAAILYTYGFGFDGFIHRATEEWIKNQGFILPKNPFYIGQYSILVWLSLLTSIPVFYLDIFFVPVLAATLLPHTVSYTLKKVCHIPKNIGITLTWCIPFLYFITLNLTTPHNVVLLYVILAIFSSLLYIRNHISFLVPLLIAIGAIVTHPLLGAPVFLFVCTLFVLKKQKRYNLQILFLYFVLLSILPSVLFIFQNMRHGFGFPHITNPFLHVQEFFALFARPYWYIARSHIQLEILYTWQQCIAPIIILFGLFGYWKQKNKSPLTHLFVLSFFGCICAAWFLRSWLFFPGVAAPEQTNYPLRFLWASPLFLLPWSMHATVLFYKKIALFVHKKSIGIKYIAQTSILLSIGTILMVSLYFSYPQRNDKARFPGYNVTAADFAAVEWIHNDNTEYNYIVLANPLTSVAALTKYSFAKHFITANQEEVFYYAIPSGGPLYKEYGNMLYKEQKREHIQNALLLTGAKKAYFVINSYWGNFDAIVAGAKKTADSWHAINNGEIYIFSYLADSALDL